MFINTCHVSAILILNLGNSPVKCDYPHFANEESEQPSNLPEPETQAVGLQNSFFPTGEWVQRDQLIKVGRRVGTRKHQERGRD